MVSDSPGFGDVAMRHNICRLTFDATHAHYLQRQPPTTAGAGAVCREKEGGYGVGFLVWQKADGLPSLPSTRSVLLASTHRETHLYPCIRASHSNVSSLSESTLQLERELLPPSSSPPRKEMPAVRSLQQRPRGPFNKLHLAARVGSTERTVALLSSASIDIDKAGPEGWTPLMIAAFGGYSRVIKILLNKGANVSVVKDDGATALHLSAQKGHLAVSKMLMKASADLEAKTSTQGNTPLHLVASRGHFDVTRALVEAGADRNCRNVDGSTPLFVAAQGGHMHAVKFLLRSKADPLLPKMCSGKDGVPLEIAAYNGHSEVVRCMIQEVGIEGCGGASGGVLALSCAAENQHVDTMAVLTDAGIVDTGRSLIHATGCGREASVKFLLQQKDWYTGGAVAYVNNTWDECGRKPLFCGITGLDDDYSASPRIVRLLVDAGADTKSAFRITDEKGNVLYHGTPLALATTMLREKKIRGQDATQEQLHRLKGIYRLMIRAEVARTASFLWPGDITSFGQAVEGTLETKIVSTPVALMLPILRSRVARPRVLLAALTRWVVTYFLL